MAKIYNLRIIKRSMSYTVEDTSRLYKIHKNTVYDWLKIGLKSIDNKEPRLIHGTDLKNFLSKQNNKNKKATQFNEFYCFHCKQAHNVYKNSVYISHKGNFLSLKGLCPITKKEMFKNFKSVDYSRIKKEFHLTDKTDICDSLHPSYKVDTHPPKIPSSFKVRIEPKRAS